MSEDRFDRYLPLAQRFGARTVLFQDAAARRLGLTATELETLRLVQLGGPVIASELAEQTGLTRASMSAIVDKLANAGLIERTQDANDRRRWILKADPNATGRVDAIYGDHAKRVERLLAEYSEHDLEVVLHFLRTFADELQGTAIDLAARADMPGDSTTKEQT
ncbi:hypothetical protein BH10PSE12_BH10PSE12_33150 [soil metagenome]